jgi:hypothetical protein
MTKSPRYNYKLIFLAIFFLAIVLLPLFNSAKAAGYTGFSCSSTGNIFDTIATLKSSGENGIPVTDPYAIFKLGGCIIAQLTTYILGLGGILSVIMIIVSGLRYMGSAGNPSAQQASVKSLNAAVVGFAIIICFWAIFNFIAGLILG